MNNKVYVKYYGDQVNDAAAFYVGAGSRNGYVPARAFALGLSGNMDSEMLVHNFFKELHRQLLSEIQ